MEESMSKLSRDELQALRAEKQKEMKLRALDNKTKEIIVSMGTTGIAAGAKETLDHFIQGVLDRELFDVRVKQGPFTGVQIGEPVVAVEVPGADPVVYHNVTPEIAERILTEHLVNNSIVQDFVKK
jgi:NADP-reducing hydrogenase subunit HndB